MKKYLDFNAKVAVLRGAIAHARKYNKSVVKYYYLQGALDVIVNQFDEYQNDDDTYYVKADYNKLGDMDDDAFNAYGAFSSNVDELEAILNEYGDKETIHVTMKFNLDVIINEQLVTLARLTSFEVPEGGMWAKVNQETGALTYHVANHQFKRA